MAASQGFSLIRTLLLLVPAVLLLASAGGLILSLTAPDPGQPNPELADRARPGGTISLSVLNPAKNRMDLLTFEIVANRLVAADGGNSATWWMRLCPLSARPIRSGCGGGETTGPTAT